MKRALSSLLVFALVLTLLVPAFAFAADKTTEEKFNELKEKGLLNGVEDGSAALDRELTRAELAAILVRLFKLEPITGQSSFIDVPAEHWAQKEGVIEAVAKAGLMGSTTTYSKTFSPDAKLTIAEVAKVAVSALKLTVDENAKIDGVQPWAAPYVDAALKAGVIAETKDYHAKANRGILVDAAYVIYNTILVPPVTDATKVESVSADNLKEIVVKFDGTVDPASASDVTKYSTTAGSIGEANVSEDGKTVTLVLASGVKMSNQTEYKVTVNKVKAGAGTVSAKDVAFTVLDNALPEVKEVTSLGTKAIKVLVSEPVEKATSTNFKLDDKSYFGNVDVNGSVITLKPYNASSVLTVGEHKLTVSGLSDFYGFKSLQQNITFEVVEDKAAPTVSEIKATLESVTVVFSEDIDPDTVVRTNFYWKSGAVKKYAGSNPVVSGNKVVLDFTNNPLPAYETTFYVEGVADYSGNKMAAAEIAVTATIDQTRPEVTEIKVSDDNKSITVKYSKNVGDSAKNRANYSIKDEDGNTVSIREVTGNVPGKTFTIVLYNELPDGINTLSISGVADITALHNVMLPYTVSLDEIGDATPPSVVSVSGAGRQIIVTFNEVMDLASISNPDNYLIEFEGNFRRLPSSNVELTPINDGKALLIYLPEKIGTTAVEVGTTVTKLQVVGVKDVAGNTMVGVDVRSIATGNASLTAYDSSKYGIKNAVLSDSKTIKVRFNQSIAVANVSDFASSKDIDSVVANGTDVVTIKLKSDIASDSDISISVKSNNKLETVTGNKVNGGTLDIQDLVAPKVNVGSTNTLDLQQSSTGVVTITVPFTEELTATGSVYNNFALDLTVVRLSDNKQLDAFNHYTTGLGGDKKSIIITLNSNAVADSKYTVAVRSGARYILDASQNTAAASDTYETDAYADATGPSFSGFELALNGSQAETITIYLDEELNLSNGANVTGFTVDGNVVTAIYDKANSKIVITSSSDGVFSANSKVSYANTGNVADKYNNAAAAVTNVSVKVVD